MDDTSEVCPNYSDSNIKSLKVKQIANNYGLRKKLKLFILLNSNSIEELFNLTTEELNEFKENYFRVDDLINSGKIYVIDYLENTNQKDILDYYLEGEDYCKIKFGLESQESILQKVLKIKTLKEAIDSEKIEDKIKCIKTIPEQFVEKDAIAEFIKENNI